MRRIIRRHPLKRKVKQTKTTMRVIGKKEKRKVSAKKINNSTSESLFKFREKYNITIVIHLS